MKLILKLKIILLTFVENFLLDNDCKIELYYIDTIFEVNNFKEPIKLFFNEIFLQLIPDFTFRMNTYFINSYFQTNNNLFLPEKVTETINNVFSRTEQYFLRRGENIGDQSFAKIYIRADTKKLEINRQYQSLLEFFADTFAFWEVIFIFFGLILSTYNKMALNFLIANELFFYKEKDERYFHLSKKAKQIEKLIKLTDTNKSEYINEKSDNNNINIETEPSVIEMDFKNEKDKENNNSVKYSGYICYEIKFFL